MHVDGDGEAEAEAWADGGLVGEGRRVIYLWRLVLGGYEVSCISSILPSLAKSGCHPVHTSTMPMVVLRITEQIRSVQ